MIISPQEVIKKVEEYYGFSTGALIDKDRSSTLAEARQTAMYLCHKYTLRSFVEIGDVLHRHHSTVIHGIRNVKKKLKSDLEYRSRVEEIAHKTIPPTTNKLIITV